MNCLDGTWVLCVVLSDCSLYSLPRPKYSLDLHPVNAPSERYLPPGTSILYSDPGVEADLAPVTSVQPPQPCSSCPPYLVRLQPLGFCYPCLDEPGGLGGLDEAEKALFLEPLSLLVNG